MECNLGSEKIFWDLTHFYLNTDDEAIERDITIINNKISSFSLRNKGKIKESDPNDLFQLTAEIEIISQKISRINSFAHLNFATQSNNAEAGAFLQKMQENTSLWQKELLFFDLEWANLDDDLAKRILEQSIIRKYRHHLEKLRKYKPYLLSETEERLLAELAPVGKSSWIKLFDKTISQKKFGRNKRTEEEVLSDLYKPNRNLRINASNEFTEGLSSQLHILTHIFNTILADKMIKDRMRRYPDWISSMNISNEISEKDVEVLIHSVKTRYDIPQRYYRIKKDLLSYDEIYDYDRYAPLPVSSKKVIPWEEATNIVLKAYADFSPENGRNR